MTTTALADEPTDSHDPRWAYGLTPEQAHRAWPCAATVDGDDVCRTRRDEHADQPEQSGFPELDITDHTFIEARDEESA